jgi:hypothetical protein
MSGGEADHESFSGLFRGGRSDLNGGLYTPNEEPGRGMASKAIFSPWKAGAGGSA